MKRDKHQKQKGVTLLELLIVAAVASIIALAIASTFSSGVAVYGKVRNYGERRLDLFLALEKLEKDLHNTFFASQMPFHGTRESMTFPGVSLDIDADDKDVLSLGEYHYYLDQGIENSLRVVWIPYYLAADESRSLPDEGEYLADIESIEFRYYYVKEGEDSAWLDEWTDSQRMPYGVEVTITALYGEEEITLQRKIFIPASKVLDEDDEKSQEEEGFFEEEL